MGRPEYLMWMHGTGVGLSVASLIIGGLHNPGIGFCIAVAIFIALELFSSSELIDKKILRIIYGSIMGGGIRRGIFIKEMFTVAVIYLAISSFALGMKTAGLSNALLGVALVISTIASELEARGIKKAIK